MEHEIDYDESEPPTKKARVESIEEVVNGALEQVLPTVIKSEMEKLMAKSLEQFFASEKWGEIFSKSWKLLKTNNPEETIFEDQQKKVDDALQ